MALAIINQAQWNQLPVMVLISLAGFVTNSRASMYFQGASTVSNTIGALTVGFLANLYARLHRRQGFRASVQQRWTALYAKLTRKPALDNSKDRVDPEMGASEGKAPRRGPTGSSKAERGYGYGLAAAAMLPAIL